METKATRIGLWVWTTLVVLFLHIPILIIILYAFNKSNVQGWPITEWSTKWFGPAIHNGEMQQALFLSLKAAGLATAIALVLGSAAAFALSFDEVIVTTFTAGVQNTLPIWIFGNIRLGQDLPEVNVVVFLILLLTIIPVTIAQRLTRESGILRTD
jgi:ABC-type spermidine/putrescine transport system permease subunit II